MPDFGPAFQTGKNVCPACDYKMDRAMSVATRKGQSLDAPPRISDLTICIKCGMLLTFAEDMTLRHLTLTEWDEVRADPDFFAQLKRLRQLITENNIAKRADLDKLN